MLGRFSTIYDAEHHIEKINEETSEDGGCLAFKDEFPFLILEILTVEFENGKKNNGIPYKFYSFDWEKTQYIASESLDRTEVSDGYKDRANAFMERLNKKED